MTEPGARGAALRRRAISIPAVLGGLVVVVPSLVVLVPLAAVYDIVRGRRLPTVRMLIFGTCYLAWEAVAIIASAGLWVVTGCGLFVRRPWSVRAHRRLQATWVESLLGLAESILELRLEVTGDELLTPGPLVVLCRHASMVDTLIPAKLLADAGLDFRYVLKTELLWDPALDIIGHRVPNHFVDRSGQNTPAELVALEQLARGAGADESVVIFPEGTRWTPSKHQRAVAKVAESDPVLAQRLEAQRYTMPLRPAGTLAILDGAADADIVIVSYTGLEGLAGPADALRMTPFRHPVRVDIRRVPRADVPTEPAARVNWLNEQWAQVDGWIATHVAP